jgi:hypothetical protein
MYRGTSGIGQMFCSETELEHCSSLSVATKGQNSMFTILHSLPHPSYTSISVIQSVTPHVSDPRSIQAIKLSILKHKHSSSSANTT